MIPDSTSSPLRILYFGDPMGALALMASGVVPVGIVHGRRGGPGWLGLLRRIRPLPRFMVPDLTDPEVVDQLLALQPTLLVSCFYPKRIPRSLLDRVPGLNVHPSDLPRWRGPDPCTWTILEGDEKTAICVHWLTEGIDEGDLVDRFPVDVRPRESAGALAGRLERQGAQRMARVVCRMADGEGLSSTAQKGEISWAPAVPADAWEIQWNTPAAEVDRFVRAASPFPGAFTGLGNELLVIFSGRPVSAGQFETLEPGTPYVHGGCAHIRCGEGAYRLGRMRLGRRPLGGKAMGRLLV